MKILIALILLSGVLAEPWGKHGLIVNYHITEVLDDILFLFKSLLRNVKSYDHKDINQEIKSFFITEGKYIQDIEAINMTFNADDFRNTYRFDSMRGLLEMNTDQPILQFLYKFNWRSKYGPIDLSVGEGTFSATSNKLSLRIYFENGRLINEIIVKFQYKLVSLNGINVDDERGYVSGALADNIPNGLQNAFNSNRDFISKYLFDQYKASYNSYKGSPMTIKNTPVRWEARAQRIITMLDTRIIVKDSVYTLDSSLRYIDSAQKDITMAINQEFVFKAIYAMYSTDRLQTSIDLKQLGYSGIMEEFFKLDPSLEQEYSKDAKVSVNSTAKSFGYALPSLSMYPMLEIEFFAKNKSGHVKEFANVLTNTTMVLAKTIVDGTEQLFSANITKVSFGLLDYYPDNDKTKEFMKAFLTKLFEKVLINKPLDLPKLRYEPMRVYKTMKTGIEGSSFLAAYTF